MTGISGWRLLWITFQTVAKVLLVASAGYATAQYRAAQSRRQSERPPLATAPGLNYIAMMILLPCMLFVHMSKVVSFSLLCEFYWAPLLSAVTLLYGYAYSTMLCNWFLAPNDAAIVQLQGTLPSSLSFLLAVMVSLRDADLPWMQESGYEEGITYLFLCTLVVNLTIWAIATHIVRVTQEIERKMNGLPPLEQANGSWFVRYVLPTFQPPLVALLLGLAFGLLPWKKEILESFGGTIVWGGLDLLGSGAVPLIIFLLGLSVVESAATPNSGNSTLSLRVVVATCLVRFFLVPLTMFLTVHALVLLHWLPSSPLLKLVLLVGSSAPTSIITTLVCTQREYRSKDVRKNLFFVYLTAIPAATLWLMAALAYISFTL